MSSPGVKRACDACHKRKVRCTGGQPCRNCAQATLECTYNAIPQKKGPKGSRAKVISELRDAQQQASFAQRSQFSPTIEGHFDFSTSPVSPRFQRDPTILTQQISDSCLTFFFANMYPTYPVFHRQSLFELVATRKDSSPDAYCLIASLCAFIMVQPGVTLSDHPGVPGIEDGTAESRYGTANALLEEVLRIRRSYDYIESPNFMAVQTSFFIFGSYFGLEKHNNAWFHLMESTTLAQIMCMHEESSYHGRTPFEDIYRRRFYWLLLVTERAYAMERHRPLTLHATIELPTLNDVPEEAPVIAGFLHLISLFSLIDDTFVNLWNKTRSDCSTAWLANLQQQLIDALPPHLNSTESQAADIKVTQQWLRTMVWQLSIMNGYLSSSSRDSSMTFKYPIEIAKDLISDINMLSLESFEVHGVGLIEKLFDIACTLTDVIACVPLETAIGDIPSDYLNQFLNLISRLRGGASRFLPLLLAKISENLPSMAPPVVPLTLSTKSEYSEKSFSPAMSSRSAPLMGQGVSPMSPYRPPPSATSDPAVLYSGYSPATTKSEGMTPAEVPHVQAPIPRSVPRIQFDGYTG